MKKMIVALVAIFMTVTVGELVLHTQILYCKTEGDGKKNKGKKGKRPKAEAAAAAKKRKAEAAMAEEATTTAAGAAS